MENNIKTLHKPLPVQREGRVDILYMAKAYTRLGFEILDYVCVHNSFPSVK